MSEFNIPLRPVAQPTNQFIAPNLKAPSNQTAAELAALGNALGQIVPELNNTFARRHEADVEGAKARARADFQQRRYQNTKALKAAVDRGEIAEADNPWYITQLRQDIAANEATERVRQMQVDWESSPVRFSDNPEEVEQWAHQQLAPVTDGRDAYESEAVFPVVQQGMGQLVGRHMEVRRAERQDERVANFTARVAQVLQGRDPQAATQQLRTLIDDARLTMSGADVNALVIKAAGETAEATGDEGVLSILGNIKNAGAGGTLADHPSVKQLQQQLPLMRMRRTMELDAMIQRQQKAREEQNKSTLLSKLMEASGNRPERVRIDGATAQAWGIPFKDVIEINSDAIRYGEMLDEQGEKQAVLVDKANARLAKGIQAQAEAALASGRLKLDDPEVADAATRIALLDPDSANQFNRYLSDRHDMDNWRERIFARESDPTVYADLWGQAKAGTLTARTLIPQSQKLSHEDWTRLLHETTKADSSTRISDFPMGKYDDLLGQMIAYPKSLEFDGVPNALELAAKDSETAGRVIRAQTRFAEVVQGLLNTPEFTRLPRDEQTVRIRKALDATAQEFGGITDGQREQAAQQFKAKQETARAKAEAAMSGTATYKDGILTLPDGQSFGTPTSLNNDIRTQVRTVAAGLRASTGDSLRSLDDIYTGNHPRSLWQILTLQGTDDMRNRDELVLSAYVHNAGLLNRGSLYPVAPWRFIDDAKGPRTEPDTLADVQTAARVNFTRQREELAFIRRRLGETWITDDRRDELKRLTAEIAGYQAAGNTVPDGKARRFTDLAENFRLYDFLGSTAGVDREDIARDYTVLYKYPAASSIDELLKLGPYLVQYVPPGELRAVQEAQKSLIDNAHDLLVNRRYVP
ncbi:MAG: hypothetical protein QM754_18205 [Tepidisphaeraceae bacterium]